MEQQLPATEITALLGRGTEFEGKLHFEGRVRIDGVFKGEIRSDDTLVIGEGAEVHAEIDVATTALPEEVMRPWLWLSLMGAGSYGALFAKSIQSAAYPSDGEVVVKRGGLQRVLVCIC